MLLFIDTETTGLPKNFNAPVGDSQNWPRLVQIAWLLYDHQGELIEEKNYYIKPNGFDIPESATRIHGITTSEATLKGLEITQIVRLLYLTIRKRKVEFIIGHNVDFDKKIIAAECCRCNFDFKFESQKSFCTMESFANYCALPSRNGFKFPKLSELYFKIFSQRCIESHKANDDIINTAKCFWELHKRGKIEIITEVNSNNIFASTIVMDIKVNQANSGNEIRKSILTEDQIKKFFGYIYKILSVSENKPISLDSIVEEVYKVVMDSQKNIDIALTYVSLIPQNIYTASSYSKEIRIMLKKNNISSDLIRDLIDEWEDINKVKQYLDNKKVAKTVTLAEMVASLNDSPAVYTAEDVYKLIEKNEKLNNKKIEEEYQEFLKDKELDKLTDDFYDNLLYT